MRKECVQHAAGGHDLSSLSNAELMHRLQARAAECTQNSMTARLTAVIDLTEELLARGYGRAQARHLLIGSGWNFTPDSFDSAISRVRKRRIQECEKSAAVDRHFDGGATGDQRSKAPNGYGAYAADEHKTRVKDHASLPSSDGAGCSYPEIFANRRNLHAAVSQSQTDQDTK